MIYFYLKFWPSHGADHHAYSHLNPGGLVGNHSHRGALREAHPRLVQPTQEQLLEEH
jgi:hypothetical protein